MSDIEKIKAEIERRKEELERDKYININAKTCRQSELKYLERFIDSLPEEDPLNDPRFGEGFDAGRAVQRIFDETEEKPSEELEEAAEDSWALYEYRETPQGLYSSCYQDGFIAGAKWMNKQMPMPEDTVLFMKGVAEGRRLEREEMEENKRKEDELPRYYGD